MLTIPKWLFIHFIIIDYNNVYDVCVCLFKIKAFLRFDDVFSSCVWVMFSSIRYDD